MSRTRIRRVALVVAMGVLCAASAGRAAPVCLAWTRTMVSPPLRPPVPQVYVMYVTPASPIGGVYFQFVGRHEGACGPGTARFMEGGAWVRGSTIELAFTTAAETTGPGSTSPTECGSIHARAVLTNLEALTGTIKYQEVNTTFGIALTEVDTDPGPPPGLPVRLVSCPP